MSIQELRRLFLDALSDESCCEEGVCVQDITLATKGPSGLFFKVEFEANDTVHSTEWSQSGTWGTEVKLPCLTKDFIIRLLQRDADGEESEVATGDATTVSLNAVGFRELQITLKLDSLGVSRRTAPQKFDVGIGICFKLCTAVVETGKFSRNFSECFSRTNHCNNIDLLACMKTRFKSCGHDIITPSNATTALQTYDPAIPQKVLNSYMTRCFTSVGPRLATVGDWMDRLSAGVVQVRMFGCAWVAVVVC